MQHLPRKHFDFRGQECLNCLTPLDLSDKYCHQCGQLNTTKRLALKDFFQEFFASFISYDSKVWRTITDLLFKPGRVTKDYCAGKRTQYANPFRFFLTVSIVFFLILQVGIFFKTDSSELANSNAIEFDLGSDNAFNTDNDSINSKEEVLKLLKTQRDSLNGNQNFIQKAAINAAIEKIESQELKITSIQEYASQSELDSMNYLDRLGEQMDNYYKYFKETNNFKPEEALKKLEHRVDDTNMSRYRKAIRFHQIGNNPGEIASILLPKIPLFLFFFAPFISLVFWLLYIRGSWNYMEHMVFNFHLLSFIFLAMYLILIEVFLLDTGFIASIFFLIIGPFYLYKALRKFYGQRRFKTIIKFLLINLAFVILLTLSSTIFIITSVMASL